MRSYPLTCCVSLQDAAAEVAAMTAELNQLAEEMLPEGTETSSDQHRKQETSLRQRLLDSWDGKVSSPMLLSAVCVSATSPLYA